MFIECLEDGLDLFVCVICQKELLFNFLPDEDGPDIEHHQFVTILAKHLNSFFDECAGDFALAAV
jgi:hypothetical protein